MLADTAHWLQAERKQRDDARKTQTRAMRGVITAIATGADRMTMAIASGRLDQATAALDALLWPFGDLINEGIDKDGAATG